MRRNVGRALNLLALLSGFLSAHVEATPIQFKQEALAQTAVGVGVTNVLGLCGLLGLGVLVWVRKRRSPAIGEAHVLRLLAARRLSTRATVYVVQFGADRYLLTEHTQGMGCVLMNASAKPSVEGA